MVKEIYDEKDLPEGIESRAYLRKMKEIRDRLQAQGAAAEAFNETAKAQHEAVVRNRLAEEEVDT